MTLPQTKAAAYLQEHEQEAISGHKVISLLLDGALERIEQAIEAIRRERPSEVAMLREESWPFWRACATAWTGRQVEK